MEENIQKPIDIVTNISKNNPFDFEVEIPKAVSPKAEIAPSIPSSKPDPFNMVQKDIPISDLMNKSSKSSSSSDSFKSARSHSSSLSSSKQ